MVGWVAVEWLRDGKATLLGTASGLVAGLVAITPAAGFVTVTSAIIFGLVAGPICYVAVQLKERLGYDDSLDVVGIHGVGGIVGGLLLGLLSSLDVNEGGAAGGIDLLISQIIAMGSVIAYSGIGTFVIVMFVKSVMGLRVSEEEEFAGLDLSIHGEPVYGSDHGSTIDLTAGAQEPATVD